MEVEWTQHSVAMACGATEGDMGERALTVPLIGAPLAVFSAFSVSSKMPWGPRGPSSGLARTPRMAQGQPKCREEVHGTDSPRPLLPFMPYLPRILGPLNRRVQSRPSLHGLAGSCSPVLPWSPGQWERDIPHVSQELEPQAGVQSQVVVGV